MTTRLTAEFKEQVTEYMLNTAKQLILENFGENEKFNKTVDITIDLSDIQISRNCFTDRTYFEDYRVSFKTIMQNKRVYSQFYLEWNRDKINKELIPANTVWDPVSGIHSKPKITITPLRI
jgi:hypothetical protein